MGDDAAGVFRDNCRHAGLFWLATRTFRSEAKLFVRMGRESVTLDPTATMGQVVAAADSRESEVNAVAELLSSRTLAEKIVDQFGPTVILELDPEKKSPSLGQRLEWLDTYNLNPLRVYSLRDKAIKAFLESVRTLAGQENERAGGVLRVE